MAWRFWRRWHLSSSASSSALIGGIDFSNSSSLMIGATSGRSTPGGGGDGVAILAALASIEFGIVFGADRRDRFLELLVADDRRDFGKVHAGRWRRWRGDFGGAGVD